MIFPSVIALINGVLQPTVTGTAAMVKGSNDAISRYLDLRQAGVSSGGWDISLSSLNPSNWIREMLRDFLEVIFEAASLCINTIRTFYLIVLAILGPFVFGLSIFDGFQHTVTVWLARYINIFLWLPVANIFGAIIGKIQENMILADASSGDPFSTTGTAYLVFLVISIVGYFTVPSVANYIVNAGGGNTLLHKVSSLTSSASKAAVNTVSSGAGMAADAFGNGASRMSGNMSDNNVSNDYFKDKVGGK
jgi:conjugative transposon TraJ protein